MCVFKYHAFIYFLWPPPWYGTVFSRKSFRYHQLFWKKISQVSRKFVTYTLSNLTPIEYIKLTVIRNFLARSRINHFGSEGSIRNEFLSTRIVVRDCRHSSVKEEGWFWKKLIYLWSGILEIFNPDPIALFVSHTVTWRSGFKFQFSLRRNFHAVLFLNYLRFPFRGQIV